MGRTYVSQCKLAPVLRGLETEGQGLDEFAVWLAAFTNTKVSV